MNLKDKLEKICSFIFDKYGNQVAKSRKLYIHDNIFGTLQFTKFERKIINSPFLQRLTNITQMGLAKSVYPGAVHNRFSHSLGVSHISERIYKEIIKEEDRFKKSGKEDINTLKLAGLLHDIAHGPFSHLAEDVINSLVHFDYPQKDIDSQIYKRAGQDMRTRIAYHEYLAYHLLGTSDLKKFIESTYEKIPVDLDLIPLCITGNSYPEKDANGELSKRFADKYKTLFIKIINGYSDSDKIDYLLRDSMFSGLPLPADIDRLLSFFTIIMDERTNDYELGVSEKGARAFNLLLLSKSKMFPTVYHHHTTLACESLLEFGIIDAIKNVKEIYSGQKISKSIWPPISCGVDLLYYTDNSLLEYLRIIDNPISRDVVKRLNNRRHYRIIERFYTWELRRVLIIPKVEFRDYVSKKKDYKELDKELKDLWNNDRIEHEFVLNKAYKEYEKKPEAKIDQLYDLFENREKLLDFKKEMVSKDKSILKKLKEKLPGVEDETLIDYVIKIKINAKQKKISEAYKQQYIKTRDKFTDEQIILNLKDMGYAIPKSLDYQQIIFFGLPEFVEQLRPHIQTKIEEITGIKFKR